MRVIAGKYKGRNLKSVEGEDTRPTLDRVRENVFNILCGVTNGAKVLDLFAGTGLVGIEALSRGAEDVVFCDKGKKQVAVIRENLKTVGEQRRVICDDYISCLNVLDAKFDVIYLDPPYGLDVDLLKIVEKLTEDGVIVYEHGAKPISYPSSVIVSDERKYGIAHVTFLKKRRKVLLTGSFDPVTNGHVALIKTAVAKYGDVAVGMLVNPDKTYLFTEQQREEMLKSVCSKMGVEVYSSNGLAVDLCRKIGASAMIRGVRAGDEEYENHLAKLNEELGGKTEFLRLKNMDGLSSTLVREKLARDEDVGDLIPEEVYDIIKKIRRK